MVVLIAACAHPIAHPPDAPSDTPTDAERHYTIWFGGAQVGTAVETERWSRSGVILRRAETLRFLRGDAPIAMTTTIEVLADPALVPSRVIWTERATATRHGEALRDHRGWQVTVDRDTARIDGDAVPAELLPLLIRRDGAYDGAVFLPARGFVVAHGRVEQVAAARLVARLVLDATSAGVEATIDLASDGAPGRIVDGAGVIERRATVAQAAAAFAPVDLIAATSVPLTGARSHRISLDGDLALPAVPGQAQAPARAGLELELSPALTGGLPHGPPGPDRSREIIALVANVRARISPDLRAGATSRRDAAVATAGDCTTFALAYAALAERRAIPTRVVTGLRVDGARLVRHRWAVSWTGRAWIAVDAAFGEAPAGGNLVGLAIHDADDAGMLAGEAALNQVRHAAWR